MNEEKQKKQCAVVGVYLASKVNSKKGAPVQSKLIDKIELDEPVKEIRRQRDWRVNLKNTIERMGFEVVSMPAFLVHKSDGIDITITVVRKDEGFTGRRGKPVSVSGRPIGSPVTGARTMASLRRGNNK